MKKKFSKLLCTAGALFAVVSTTAFAENATSGTKESTCSSCPTCPTPCGAQGTYQRGTYREITPNAGPRVCHGADVYVSADFIYWNVSQEGLVYGTTGLATALPNQNNGKQYTVGEEWAPGFKVGLGLDLSHDGWDLFGEYTWLYSDDSNNISAPSIQTAALNAGGAALVSSTAANSNWNLHFNVIDLSLGRNFFLSQYLTLRPHFGLKGTWQEQNWTTNLSGVTSTLGSFASGKLERDFDMWGVGLRTGLDFGWFICKNWSLRAKMAVSALWSNYDSVKGVDSWTQADGTSVAGGNVGYDSDSNGLRYVAELFFGGAWDTWFCDDNYHFGASLGWEEQLWFASNLFGNGNLSLQGVTAKLRFDF